MTAKITVLYDNRCSDTSLQEGWGFSVLVEFEGSKILFDTGGDEETFSSNAAKLAVPYHEITHLVFSHRHWDHIAGYEEIVRKLNPDTKLVVPKSFLAFRRKKFFPLKIKVVSSFDRLAPNIYSLVLKGGFRLYEQALILKTAEGLGIITGCAHPGIVQIVEEAKQRLSTDISFVMGGFHQLFSPPHQTAEVVKKFQNLHVKKVAPCHCSGDHLIRQFQNAYGPHFFKIGAGSILTF